MQRVFGVLFWWCLLAPVGWAAPAPWELYLSPDYKRTSMIRGEQEWVSQVEGGALYNSDSWGLSHDGQAVVEGQDANYNNFRGENPVFRET